MFKILSHSDPIERCGRNKFTIECDKEKINLGESNIIDVIVTGAFSNKHVIDNTIINYHYNDKQLDFDKLNVSKKMFINELLSNIVDYIMSDEIYVNRWTEDIKHLAHITSQITYIGDKYNKNGVNLFRYEFNNFIESIIIATSGDIYNESEFLRNTSLYKLTSSGKLNKIDTVIISNFIAFKEDDSYTDILKEMRLMTISDCQDIILGA